MRYTREGVELNVEIDGPQDGIPVVLLHGVSGSVRTYDWLPAEITAGRWIIRVDLRGHGASGHAPGRYLIEHYGEDVAAILRDVVGRPAVLVGHSLGGVVSWWVAQRYPELVRAAFLEDPPLYMGEPDEHKGNGIAAIFPLLRDRAIAWRRAGVEADRAAALLAAEAYIPDGSIRVRDVIFDDALFAEADAHLRMDPDVLTVAANGSTLAATNTSAPIEVPVLILAADESLGAAFSSAHQARLGRSHPRVEVVRVSGAGHRIHDSRASRDDYAARLDGFLRCHA